MYVVGLQEELQFGDVQVDLVCEILYDGLYVLGRPELHYLLVYGYLDLEYSHTDLFDLGFEQPVAGSI